MRSSFDTNVLIYASAETRDASALRALDLLERAFRSGATVLLLQSLGEFCNAGLRRQRLPMRRVRALLDAWTGVLQVRQPAIADIVTALWAVDRHKLQFWDAMLRATADRVGVEYLLTEDMQDGRVLGGVRFVNPFDPKNDALIDRILPA